MTIAASTDDNRSKLNFWRVFHVPENVFGRRSISPRTMHARKVWRAMTQPLGWITTPLL